MVNLRLKLTCLMALVFAASSQCALAGRPLQTEDAGVLGDGDCEVESVFARQSGHGEPSVREASLQLGCGIGGRTQLALGAAHARNGDARAHGLAITGKTWLRELTEAQAGLTLAYAVAGARAAGQSFKHEATEAKVVLSVPLESERWLLHGNLGWARAEADRRNSTIWSAAIERTGLGRFDLMAEFFGDDRDAPWWNIGLRYAAIENQLFLDASFGTQLSGARPRLLTVGLKYAF